MPLAFSLEFPVFLKFQNGRGRDSVYAFPFGVGAFGAWEVSQLYPAADGSVSYS